MRLQPVRLKSRSVAVMAVSALAVAAAIVPAVAATPGSGSVSDTSPTATWTAGPFAVPNVTGQTGEVSCTAATPCDDYALNVDVPAGYDADHSLRVDVTWPNSAADFDIYVLDAAGAVVSSAASSSDPETILLPAVGSSYTVRVVPFAPLARASPGPRSWSRTRLIPPRAPRRPPASATTRRPRASATRTTRVSPRSG